MQQYLGTLTHADKSAERREEMERAFKTINEAFGPAQAAKITAAHIEKYYTTLRKSRSISKAGRIMKDVWFLFNRLEKQNHPHQIRTIKNAAMDPRPGGRCHRQGKR